MENIISENFSIYKVAKTNLYAAIPREFLRFIRQCVVEYQGLSLVPADKQVKAILLRSPSHHQFSADSYITEQQIPINSLQFESEEF
jgi:hypothetical protein